MASLQMWGLVLVRGWSFIHIAPIKQDCWVDHAYDLVNILKKFFLCSSRSALVIENQVHICIRKPGKAMDVRAGTMQPLEVEPVVSCTKESDVEGVNEFGDALVEEQVSMAGFSCTALL